MSALISSLLVPLLRARVYRGGVFSISRLVFVVQAQACPVPRRQRDNICEQPTGKREPSPALEGASCRSDACSAKVVNDHAVHPLKHQL